MVKAYPVEKKYYNILIVDIKEGNNKYYVGHVFNDIASIISTINNNSEMYTIEFVKPSEINITSKAKKVLYLKNNNSIGDFYFFFKEIIKEEKILEFGIEALQ